MLLRKFFLHKTLYLRRKRFRFNDRTVLRFHASGKHTTACFYLSRLLSFLCMSKYWKGRCNATKHIDWTNGIASAGLIPKFLKWDNTCQVEKENLESEHVAFIKLLLSRN